MSDHFHLRDPLETGSAAATCVPRRGALVAFLSCELISAQDMLFSIFVAFVS